MLRAWRVSLCADEVTLLSPRNVLRLSNPHAEDRTCGPNAKTLAIPSQKEDISAIGVQQVRTIARYNSHAKHGH
jgi:hypothetical protein